MMATIVVVHGAGDSAAAEDCCGRLEAAGASTWTPSRDLDPALDPQPPIENGLDQGDGLLLLSDDGRASPAAIGMVDLALARNKPCYLSVPAGTELDSHLSQRHWKMTVDAATDDLGLLVASVASERSVPPEMPLAAPPVASNYVRATDEGAPFRPLEGPAAWAISVVTAGSILGGLEALSGYRQVMLLFGGGGTTAIQRAATLSDAFDVVQLLSMVLLILGAVTVLIWMSRAIKNLPSLGVRDYPFKAAFAVGSFFIPFANLYVPYKAMADLARGSSPISNLADPTSWKLNRAPVMSVLWTIFWLSANIISTVQGRVEISTTGPAGQVAWANGYLTLAEGTTTLLAGICLCLLISQITTLQQDRFESQALAPQVESFAKTKSVSRTPALVVGGLLAVAALALAVPRVALDPEKAEKWFSQSVPGTALTALLPEVVKPEVDHEEGLTVNDWTAQQGTDTFSIVDYQLPSDAAAAIDDDAVKGIVDHFGQQLGTPIGKTTAISLGSLKGFASETTVDKPLIPAGSKGFLRGFASGSHVVLFMCILTQGELSEPLKEKFFASINSRGGVR